MHLLDRCGQIVGSPEELARLGRSTPSNVELALQDLERTNAADVLRCNGVVTVTNRRMRREFESRENGANRVKKHRTVNGDSPPCNGDVTPHSQSPYSQSQIPESEPNGRISPTADGGRKTRDERRESSNRRASTAKTLNPQPSNELRPSPLLTIMSLDRIAREIMSNRWGWAYDNCKVMVTDFSQGSLVTVLKPFVDRATEGQVQQAWVEAIRRAHGAAVDNLVDSTPAGYAVACFRELLGKSGVRGTNLTTDEHG